MAAVQVIKDIYKYQLYKEALRSTTHFIPFIERGFAASFGLIFVYIYRMQIKQLHSEATIHVYLDNVTVCKMLKQFQLPVDFATKVRVTDDKS